MQKYQHMRGRGWARAVGTWLVVLAMLSVGLADPIAVFAQSAGDATPADQADAILVPPGDAQPLPPLEPAPWDGPVETLEYVEPSGPVDSAAQDAALAGTSMRLIANKTTFISSGDPTDSFGNLPTTMVGWPNQRFQATRTLVKFDVGPIPNRARILSAQLNLFQDSATPPGGQSMQLNGALATRSWGEGDATWANASNIGGGQFVLGNVDTRQGWKSFDLRNPVQGWVNGQSNNGMVIIGFEVSPNSRTFRSRRFGGSEPFLQVTFQCDTLAPRTLVSALPAESPASFDVRWGGQDLAPGGCQPTGINKFHVDFNINGGAWQTFKGGTTSTQATFRADDWGVPSGALVGFRVWADDNAGNRETPPNRPQASTRVISAAPTVGMTPLPQFTYGSSFTINWAPISAPNGVASYDVQWSVNNGTWTDLLPGTQLTSFTINNAQSEFRYAFRVRARDRFNNVGTFPAAPQAQTTVVLNPIARMLPLNPSIINSSSPVTTSFALAWTGASPSGLPITSYQIHYQIRNMANQVVQPWSVWQTFGGSTTSATFTIPANPGVGIYEFEATASNQQGTTPFAGRAEAIMVVDWNDTIKFFDFLPIIFRH